MTVLAAICYSGAAIFSRGFKKLDLMAPATGSLLSGGNLLAHLGPMVPVSFRRNDITQPETLSPVFRIMPETKADYAFG